MPTLHQRYNDAGKIEHSFEYDGAATRCKCGAQVPVGLTTAQRYDWAVSHETPSERAKRAQRLADARQKAGLPPKSTTRRIK
jgi:hypothetical protein